jgi:hypothetical protein
VCSSLSEYVNVNIGEINIFTEMNTGIPKTFQKLKSCKFYNTETDNTSMKYQQTIIIIIIKNN